MIIVFILLSIRPLDCDDSIYILFCHIIYISNLIHTCVEMK